MDKKDIEELIKFVKKTGVSEVSIEQEGLKITIKTHPAPQQVFHASMPMAMPVSSGSQIASGPPGPGGGGGTRLR